MVTLMRLVHNPTILLYQSTLFNSGHLFIFKSGFFIFIIIIINIFLTFLGHLAHIMDI